MVFYELPQGPVLRLRPIGPGDKGALAVGLQHLSADSTYKRFLSPKPRLSSRELAYLTEVDQHDHVAWVAEPVGAPGCIVASGRWVRLADQPDTAEAAIVVADVLQGRGVGRELGRILAEEAHRHGVTRFSATMLGDNLPALALFRSISQQLESRVGGGVRELVADLRPAVAAA
jgi:GNAT superfamily N-acetyltransferase